MVIETQARETTAFEGFLERTLPPQLREGAGIPASWSGGADEWRVLADAARAEHRRRALYDFAFSIACQGYQPHELATGELDRGATVKVNSGQVKRPPPSTLSPELEMSARRARDELQARRLTVDVPLQVAIEAAAAGSYTSEPAQLLGAIRAATAAVLAHDRTHEVASEEQAAKTKVRMLATAGPARRYEPGTYRLTDEEVRELEEWAHKVESQAGGRSLGSLGYKTWPAFIVEAA